MSQSAGKNRLIDETSPYLLQHKDNPVHWFAWGEDAFAEAKQMNRPILLSIGYAACHWCHVMAHESFEDHDIAELMNTLFINIKVDREEFPDVDKIYMDALHAFGERGGWPLTMFLEPDGTPIWGGTYFPKTTRYGRPGFDHVLKSVANAWTNNQDKISANKQKVLAALTPENFKASGVSISNDDMRHAATAIVRMTDKEHGGLTGAPKFPQTTVYEFLWRQFLKTGDQNMENAVIVTLENMCNGGIYDHLAGGFSRYSVDEFWLVPHFEKMLYDSALLVDLLILVDKRQKSSLFRSRIKQTINWMLDELMTNKGALGASLDADSEGEEGRFYVWDDEELKQVIPEVNQKEFFSYYRIRSGGNWEGKTILNRLGIDTNKPDMEKIEDTKSLLMKRRKARVRPGTDDKVLVDWNSLAIHALTNASQYLNDIDLLTTAESIYRSMLKVTRRNGQLFHAFRQAKTTNRATAEDFANLIKAALRLFEVTRSDKYLKDAEDFQNEMDENFHDPSTGTYFFSSKDSSLLIARSRYFHDDATPNANGTTLTNLSKLYMHTGNETYRSIAERLMEGMSGNIANATLAHCGALRGILDFMDPVHATIITKDHETDADELIKCLDLQPIPIVTSVITTTDHLPDNHPAKGKQAIDGQTTLYLCQGQTCLAPITDYRDISETLKTLIEN